MKSGIILISELSGDLREQVLEVQRRFDPKLAKTQAPHVTLSFFRELSHADEKALLSLRIKGPVLVDHIAAHKTVGLVNTTEVLRLPLGANPA